MSEKIIVVTGGAGFVGSNLIKKLNENSITKIIVIDDYDERKLKNIKDCSFIDYISYKNGVKEIGEQISKYDISAVLHIGANADVLIRDANIMFDLNYEHSKFYLNYCLEKKIPLIYASSSAIYGNSNNCVIENEFEDPHNVYAWSKWMFDKLVLNNIENYHSKVIGLRFFNIFGMGEFHKDKNASLPHRFYQFINENGFIDLFDREILRDYVWVEDVTQIIIDILFQDDWKNGIYNLGSGTPISHESLAQITTEIFVARQLKSSGDDLIKKIAMPENLLGSFQFFTKAENLEPRIAKYTANNKEKVKSYINELIDFHQ
ncbi:ADP-glyceromanno-heptose 6-epimerase precursor [Mucilaginibacter pineti]|uniref:ADP-glyceromanno-heptose 6-epimerase n=1 Tax=Mucilaginibacter pineti TaxID=1391627 RepID=A0A1G6ZGX9_9SPHI|nr:NAD-dependent epimerase/dehydratase family protein [Mucilaginibacter pineti]SDE01085.1 ADP-glyceromanno-heptose 6-epimerase precursor [Mucilaginibacter pineti]